MTPYLSKKSYSQAQEVNLMESALQQTESGNIHVMLMLAGGHQCEIALPSADVPLLRELFDTLLKRSQNQNSGKLFKIPMDEGRSALYFPSSSLVSIATDPPMLVDSNGLIVKYLQKYELPSTYQSGVQYEQIDNFLTPEEHQRILDYVLAKESEFMPTTTTGNVPDYRQSKVSYNVGEFTELITHKLHSVLPTVLTKLGLSPFHISRIETNLTVHNDGDYYKAHDDNGCEETCRRQISYIYYFNQEPKAFSGGELRLYDCKIENNYWNNAWVNPATCKTVQPRNNSIVFFFSGYLHEVMPVSCPSKNFAHSRFTLNGWLQR